jgi:hypothetical protein
MKSKSVKTKIIQLIKHYGARKKVAEILNVELSYIYKLEKKAIPGWHLYCNILKIYKEIYG